MLQHFIADQMWCVARFCTICAILRTWKTPMEAKVCNFGTKSRKLSQIQYSYFPCTILECNKLDVGIRKSKSFLSFRNSLLKIGGPTVKPTNNIHNPIGLIFISRLSCSLSQTKQTNANIISKIAQTFSV